MEDEGLETAHMVGNSLGGYVALQLASRGRAETGVALAPAGGWRPGDGALGQTLGLQSRRLEGVKAATPHAETVVASAQGRRQATQYITTNFEHIPAELLVHQLRGTAGCVSCFALIDYARQATGTSMPSESPAPFGSCGAPTIAFCRGRRPLLAFAKNGCPTPSGSS